MTTLTISTDSTISYDSMGYNPKDKEECFKALSTIWDNLRALGLEPEEIEEEWLARRLMGD